MDLNDINKTASRKRMNAEAEKLREKVSHETAKIIKLKVAQDTAYWDLKEKLQQVESNHEKLQQNMVEVQMQHEAISGQYQEELRLRPDTLNKVSSTREMCGVLQEYSERLRDTLSRCAADQSALNEAYQRSGQLVRELRAQQAAEAERNRVYAAGLQEKVQLLTDHQNQLVQLFANAKQQADAQISELNSKLASAAAHEAELLVTHNELNKELDQYRSDIQKKEETIASLHAEMKQLMQEFNNQATEARSTLADQDKKIKDLKEENKSSKKAIENQGQFIKSTCEQNNVFQEKIAVLEEEHLALLRTIDEQKVKTEEASRVNLSLQSNIISLNDEKQSLLQQAQDTEQIINNLEAELRKLQADHTKVENERAQVVIELDRAVEESKSKATEVDKLTAFNATLETTVSEIEAAFKAHRDVTVEKNKELNATIAAKDNELDSKASTINQLMSQLKTSSEVRSKLEIALQKIKKEIEIERDSVKEKENEMANTIGKLEASVRAKDDELSKQMSIILEIRNEKERLQKKIQSMQNTIDNIQKELTRPPAPTQPAAPRLMPELDDNAVMLTPSHKQTQLLQPTSPILPRPPPAQFTVPRAQEPDSMLYSLFSDSSMEGDALDTSEVNRRFNALARGERLSPAPLAALKRRSGVSAAQSGLRHKPSANPPNNDIQLSLSQVKNDLKNKERTFFKNKRLDNKPKRAK